MENVLQIVIPMAGRASRFENRGYSTPKAWISIQGHPMIEWVIENVRPLCPHRFIFLCQDRHVRENRAAEWLAGKVPGSTVISVPAVTEGAACTVLLAREELLLDQPLLLVNSDQYFTASIDDFISEMRTRNADGGVMTMPATDPKWSYARMDRSGYVVEVAEKRVISDQATVGVYYFKRAQDYMLAADQMIAEDYRVRGEFYVAPTYNYLIRRGKRVLPFRVSEMFGLGTPEDLETFVSNPISKTLSMKLFQP